VARLASLPPEVLANAKRVSEEFEEEMNDASQQKSKDSAADYKQKIMEAMEQGNWDELNRIWQELKQ
jgi:DNA mismatch repair ATPase MutS